VRCVLLPKAEEKGKNEMIHDTSRLWQIKIDAFHETKHTQLVQTLDSLAKGYSFGDH
jgi:hypothetical protein